MIYLKNTFTEWFLLIWCIDYKKVYLFQLVAFKKIYFNEKCLLFQLVVMNNYRKQSQKGVLWNQLKSENIDILYSLSIERTSADSL